MTTGEKKRERERERERERHTHIQRQRKRHRERLRGRQISRHRGWKDTIRNKHSQIERPKDRNTKKKPINFIPRVTMGFDLNLRYPVIFFFSFLFF